MNDEQNHDEPVVIFSGTIWEAEVVKSLLENAEIEAFLLDEFTGTLAPWYTAGGGAGAVRVVVAESDLVSASEVVTEFERNRNENLASEPDADPGL